MKDSIQLHTLLALLPNFQLLGTADRVITGVVYDSRKVQAGSLFVAIKGYHVDGHAYIPQALQRGASAIIADERYVDGSLLAQIHQQDHATMVIVSDSRTALAPLAATWYGHPSHQLGVIGITGTKGKSTTTMLTSHVLERCGHATGMISTVDFKIGSQQYPNTLRQSTPEAPEVQAMLRQMVEAHCAYAVIESSSHALSARWSRLGHCAFDVAVLTNVTHEHLDYHGTLEQYRRDKMRLFAMLTEKQKNLPTPAKYAIVNADDPYHRMFLNTAPDHAQQLTYGLTTRADIHANNIVTTSDGSHMRITTPWGSSDLSLQLPGIFNVLNALATLSVALSQQIPLTEACTALSEIRSIRGRMERIEQGQPFTVIVDYAHNPDSFTQVMEMMRALATGRLIAVFGSAGERDVEKRAQQGAIAARSCALLILTDEDPRGEDREAIIADIARGAEEAGKTRGKGYLVIPDRAAAIRTAIEHAAPGDVVLLLGKGHEGSIEYAEGKVPWDEAAEARAALQEAGYTLPGMRDDTKYV